MNSLARQVIRTGRVTPHTASTRVFSQLQLLLGASRANSFYTAQGKARWLETGGAAVAKGHVGCSRRASTLAAKGPRSPPLHYGRHVVSLDPQNFRAMGQELFDISEQYHPGITVHGRVDASQSQTLRLNYCRENRKECRFPTGTLGVLYFHHIEGDDVNSQLRFRLCRDLDEFPNGSDLLLPDGRTWSRSLQHMARTRQAYFSLLALLSEEFPILPAQIHPRIDSRRIVTTLSPQDFVSKDQKAFDISGILRPNFTFGSARDDDQHDWVALTFNKMRAKLQPFPPDTVGLLYYKQSSSCPAKIGEVRFRLCSDVSTFEQGSDLSLPSGDSWFISSHALHTSIFLRSVANMLHQDGLLEPLDSSPAHRVETIKHPKVPVLTRISQPFVLNLSHHHNILALQVDPSLQPLNCRLRFWGQRFAQQSPYRGRILVQLEEHPDGKAHSHLIVQLRVLELLTPVVQVDDVECIAYPEPGQLFSVLRHGRFVPWTYTPSSSSRQSFADFMELSKRGRDC